MAVAPSIATVPSHTLPFPVGHGSKSSVPSLAVKWIPTRQPSMICLVFYVVWLSILHTTQAPSAGHYSFRVYHYWCWNPPPRPWFPPWLPPRLAQEASSCRHFIAPELFLQRIVAVVHPYCPPCDATSDDIASGATSPPLDLDVGILNLQDPPWDAANSLEYAYRRCRKRTPATSNKMVLVVGKSLPSTFVILHPFAIQLDQPISALSELQHHRPLVRVIIPSAPHGTMPVTRRAKASSLRAATKSSSAKAVGTGNLAATTLTHEGSAVTGKTPAVSSTIAVASSRHSFKADTRGTLAPNASSSVDPRALGVGVGDTLDIGIESSTKGPPPIVGDASSTAIVAELSSTAPPATVADAI